MWHIRACIAKSDPEDFIAFQNTGNHDRRANVLKKTLKKYNKIYSEIFGRERVTNVAFAIAVVDKNHNDDMYQNNQSNTSSVSNSDTCNNNQSSVSNSDTCNNNQSNTSSVMYDDRSELVAVNDINNNGSKIDDSGNIDDDYDDDDDEENDDPLTKGKKPRAPPTNVFLYIITKGTRCFKVGICTVATDRFIRRYHTHVGEFSYLRYEVVHEDMYVAEKLGRAIEIEFKAINMKYQSYSNLEFFHKRDYNKKDLLPKYRKCLVSLIRKHLQIEVRNPFIIPL